MIRGSKSWPPNEAFMEISGANQIVDGRARCTVMALCDERGQPIRNFYLGQPAHFFYEFEVLDEINAPAGGVEIADSDGRIIHGKNTFQYDISVPKRALAGDRLRYHQVICLELGAGEYTFTVTLASIQAALYTGYRKGTVAEHVFRPAIREHCRVQNVGSFIVDYHPTAKLLHHGMTNLPGNMWVKATKAIPETSRQNNLSTIPVLRRVLGWRSGAQSAARVVGRGADDRGSPAAPATITQPVVRDGVADDTPTIFHVTHWKAGSQWIYKILHYCASDRIVEPQVGETQFLHRPLQPGKIYPTVYVTKQQFDSVTLPANSHRFVVIRDLRDTLISGYFSIKLSHSIQTWMQDYQRAALRSLSLEDGLIYLMDEWLIGCARIQTSWVEGDEPVIRYEDLLERDLEILERLLLDECRLPIAREILHKAVLTNRFENLTGGRVRGQEEITAHIRKGIAGDWRNYFNERVKRAFKIRYGGLLIVTGYEKDMNW